MNLEDTAGATRGQLSDFTGQNFAIRRGKPEGLGIPLQSIEMFPSKQRNAVLNQKCRKDTVTELKTAI
jgi:hypothetical protein